MNYPKWRTGGEPKSPSRESIQEAWDAYMNRGPEPEPVILVSPRPPVIVPCPLCQAAVPIAEGVCLRCGEILQLVPKVKRPR